MRHIRLAFRTLFRTPFVTAVAVLSLALGIGANAAIFSLGDQMLLRPLPVPEPQRLIALAAPGPKPGSQSCNQAGECDEIFSYSMFRDLERSQTVLTGLAAHRVVRRQPGHPGRADDRRRDVRIGLLLPHPGTHPRAGPAAGPGGRRDPRQRVRRGAELQLLEFPLRCRPRRAGPVDRGERADVDGRRCGARRDSRGPPLAPGPWSSSRSPWPGRWSGFTRLREPPGLLGLPLRAAEAGRQHGAGQRRAQRHLPADHHRRRSAAAAGHERPDHGAVQGQGDRGRAGVPGPEFHSHRRPRRRC